MTLDVADVLHIFHHLRPGVTLWKEHTWGSKCTARQEQPLYLSFGYPMSLKSKGRGQQTSMLCLCPNSAWVVLDQCCIGWINTAVSIHCDSFERKSQPKLVATSQQEGCSWKNASIQKPARKPLFYEAETVCLPCRAPVSMPLRMIQKLRSMAARFWCITFGSCRGSGGSTESVFAPEAMIFLNQW